jgi:hypothetical protein
MEWPSLSPDLNSSENLRMTRHENRGEKRQSKNLKELEQKAKDEWTKFSVDACRNLVTITLSVYNKIRGHIINY